jgi:hypothetical protein
MKKIKMMITLMMCLISTISFSQERDNTLDFYGEYTTKETHLNKWQFGSKILKQVKIIEDDKTIYIFSHIDGIYNNVYYYKSFIIEDIDKFMIILTKYLTDRMEVGVRKNFLYEGHECSVYRNNQGSNTFIMKHKIYNFYFHFYINDLKNINKGLSKVN